MVAHEASFVEATIIKRYFLRFQFPRSLENRSWSKNFRVCLICRERDSVFIWQKSVVLSFLRGEAKFYRIGQREGRLIQQIQRMNTGPSQDISLTWAGFSWSLASRSDQYKTLFFFIFLILMKTSQFSVTDISEFVQHGKENIWCSFDVNPSGF
jgi:hypothetical protein